MTPWQYARLPLKKIETLAMKFISQMEKARNPKTGELYATEYIEKHVDAIKSWTSWNSKTIGNRKLKVAKLNPRPLASKEKLPPPEELRRLLYASTTPKRTRVVIAGTAHAGLRFMSYGDYKGTDGIRIKDFPELKIVTDEKRRQKEVIFEKKPAWCRIRWNLSKTRKPYESKWSVEACDVLKDYLDDRIRSGEILDLESGIVVTTEEDRRRLDVPHEKLGVLDASPFLCSGKVAKLVKDAMDAIGLNARPYIWRHFFDSKMMVAQDKGYIIHAYQQFLMGHTGDIEATYTLNKQLPPDIEEGLSESYRKIQPLLQTKVTNGDLVSEEKARRISKTMLFTTIGFSEKEIEELKLLDKKDDEITEIVNGKILQVAKPSKRDEVYVKPEKMEEFHSKGYDYHASLPDGRVVMRLG